MKWMNKTALKTFATNARRELLKKVEARAMKIGIKEDNIKKADIESSDAIFIDGRQLSKEEKVQRDRLIDRIRHIGFKQVMEEVAYTWFNRFTALRFMEVNDYLPTKVRVLSSTNAGSTEPDMMKEALSLDLDLDKEYIYELKMNNNSEELFKYLIIKHCNDLNRYMPFMFKKIDDYTEILFPEGMLSKDSFIRQMTDTNFIPEDNWNKVEVIGWLYQYYIAEEKDRVIKAKKKYKPEEIPFATQLFTPEWIVRYMVQNTLGRYWLESHPEHKELLGNWEYYLENQDSKLYIEEKLTSYINKDLKVEDIKCFDPAMGSGHILVYMFDVLYEIYEKCGYMGREIPRLIIENNLYGLDIDDRAYQLACFSIVMKALEYNSRFFRSIEREGLTLHLRSIQETNQLDEDALSYIAGENNGETFEEVKKFITQFKDAKILGSLIDSTEYDKEMLEQRLESIKSNPAKDLFEEDIRKVVLDLLPDLLKQAEIMNRQYDILVTNPPYMGNKYMDSRLTKFIQTNYSETKYDLFSAFMQYSLEKVKKSGHLGFMTPFVWMFISTYQKLRNIIIEQTAISSLIQLEYSAFEGATVPICTFTLRNNKDSVFGEYIKLSNFPGANNQPLKTMEAISNPDVNYRFTYNILDFNKIPGNPIAFWISDRVKQIFEEAVLLGEVCDIKAGLQTNDNNKFLRMWNEVSIEKIGFKFKNRNEAKNSQLKWFPYNKGGNYRKWYGNNEYVVNWENDGLAIHEYNNLPMDYNGAPVRNKPYYFKKSITWTLISSSYFGVRCSPEGSIFDIGAHSLFCDEGNYLYFAGLLNTKFSSEVMKILNPTLNLSGGVVSNMPLIIDETRKKEIGNLVTQCINISKSDWDSYETSWDFKKHPFLTHKIENEGLEEAYKNWVGSTEREFQLLKRNEEELNRIYLETYGLQNEMSPNLTDNDITIVKADIERDVISFISYFVGCLLGRYSLDDEGLVYAGGKFDPNRYRVFKADKDNILPILTGAYFEDDIVSRFIEFVGINFGEGSLLENLDFVADALGRKKGETAKETLRRYFLNDFYKDHVKTYSKRPIYWLFTSGKEKAFNCLIYIHRYDKTTLSRIRTDYLHDYQIRLDAEKKDLLNIIEGDSTAKEISNAKKELKSLDKKIEELKAYDELLHHMADMQIEIDLDDGVKVNYEKFKGLVAKI